MKRISITLLVLLLVTACAGSKTPTALPTGVPALTSATSTPMPANAAAFNAALPLTVDNISTIQPLIDLQFTPTLFSENISDLVFLPGTDQFLIAIGDQSAMDGDIYRGVTSRPSVYLWDPLTATGRQAFTAPDVGTPVYRSLAVSPDGTHVAFVGTDQVVLATAGGSSADGHLSFTTQSLPLGQFTISDDAGVAFSADSTKLAVMNIVGDVQVWIISTGDVLHTFLTSGGLPPCMLIADGVGFTPDGNSVLFVCDDDLFIEDLSTFTRGGRLLTYPGIGSFQNVFTLSPDGSTAVTGDNYKGVHVWDSPSGQVLTATQLDASITALRFNADGKLLASANRNGTLTIWDTHDWQPLVSLTAHADLLAFSPDGRFLVTLNHQGGGTMWGVIPTSAQVTMSGVKVVVTKGPLNMDAWQAAVPQGWLAPSGTLARYEIHLSSQATTVDTCSYTLSSGSVGTLNRVRSDVIVDILDLQDGSRVAQTEFPGGNPDPCPANYSYFSSSGGTVDIGGASPDFSAFLPWLKGIMGTLGFQ